MTSVELEFVSKDQILADYYSECFKDWFTRELIAVASVGDPVDEAVMLSVWSDMMVCWNARMLCEAKLQEHYDYIEGEGQVRQPLFDDNGEPVLLIPTIQLAVSS